MLQKEYWGPADDYDKHRVSLSSTRELADTRAYSNVALESGCIPLKIFQGICFCASYVSLFHKSER